MLHRVIVRRGSYQDSARLMRIARALAAVDTVASADVMMGTAANVEMLVRAGFNAADLQDATPMDMVVALRADKDDALDAAEKALATLLSSTGRGELAACDAGMAARDAGREARPGNIEEAVRWHPGANLVSIAVPGPYAAFVANRALDAGRNVFLFSDNVPLDAEVTLKKRACASGLLMMGPDCGTAIIAGVGLGFANRVPRGGVGIVGASGTGTQEVSCLVSRLGAGVSHAIGTGSRDLSAAVNGMMSESALRLLAEDAATRVIVFVAKHPAPAVADRMHSVLANLGKPCIVRYLGEPARPAANGVVYAESLDEAATIAAGKAGGSSLNDDVSRFRAAGSPTRQPRWGASLARDDKPSAQRSPRLIGLFGGGSLASEAQCVLAAHGIVTTVPSRPLVPGNSIPGTDSLIVDTGDDAYTVGRPHPMVDQAVRCGLIRTAGADRSVGLILLDLVLGDGAHPDPAPEIAAAVADARGRRNGAPLEVVCSVCGSDQDPQDFGRQLTVLKAAGVDVETTAARAAAVAARLCGGGPR